MLTIFLGIFCPSDIFIIYPYIPANIELKVTIEFIFGSMIPCMKVIYVLFSFEKQINKLHYVNLTYVNNFITFLSFLCQ